MSKIEENPVKLFDSWLKEAANSGINEPEALSLATSTKDGKPSNRMVLLKGHDDKGFVFFTNLESKKGEDIDENPFVSMCFFWPTINKQVRIEGKVEKVSNNEADDYFDSRALNSKIGAIVSKQSRRIEENDFDLFKSTAMKSFKLLATNEVKRPDYWSGYRLVANRIEFWQRGEFRIHKRTSYERENGDKDWNINFLYP
jgi:pyridoxamine 5'-phosphate oxidase